MGSHVFGIAKLAACGYRATILHRSPPKLTATRACAPFSSQEELPPFTGLRPQIHPKPAFHPALPGNSHHSRLWLTGQNGARCHVYENAKNDSSRPDSACPRSYNDASCIIMPSRPIKTRQPVPGGEVDRITLSLASEDKEALARIAEEKKVSIAWVIRDAITCYLGVQAKGTSGDEDGERRASV